MKNNRNNFEQQVPFVGFPANMMMFPNYLNDNYSNLDAKVSSLEKKIKVLENRVSRLESPYQNNTPNYNAMQNNQMPIGQTYNNSNYQSTQNNNPYNGEMYMM